MRLFVPLLLALAVCGRPTDIILPAPDYAKRVCVVDPSMADMAEPVLEAIDYWNDVAGCTLLVPGCHEPHVVVTSWQPKIDDPPYGPDGRPYDDFYARLHGSQSPLWVELKQAIVFDQVYQDVAHEFGHVLGLAVHTEGLMAARRKEWDPVGTTNHYASNLFRDKPPTRPTMWLMKADREFVKGLCP